MQLKGKTAVVTGASGMLGAYLCRSLLQAGCHVRGTIRNPAKAPFLADMGVELVKADLTDPDSLRRAFENADALVNNAAHYTLLPTVRWKAFRSANVLGTDNVYDALCEVGPKRVVQISTWGVYRFAFRKAMDEETPRINGEKKEGGAYRATKAISEEKAWQAAARCQLDLTAVRPAGIYGARDQNTLPKARAALRMPLLPHLGVEISMAYAGDVANGVVGALKNDASIGQAYNLGGDDQSFGDFLVEMARVDGKANARFPLSIPSPLVWKLNSDKARADLDFKNRSYGKGLEETYALEADPALWGRSVG